jgi:magnesium chelatase accessory protein
MDWARDGHHWPHHAHSRFVNSGGRRWHVQQWPAPSAHAPQLLLLHGTGASIHSWHRLAPLLALQAGVLAVDLPGHGFSDPARGDGASLGGMARGIAALLRQMDQQPGVLLGQSAGAAIAVQMALDCEAQARDAPVLVISLNGALLPPHGLAGQVFSPLAKLLAANRLVPQLFSWRAADKARVRRLVASTGSSLDDAGVALYGRLVSDPAHVAGALAMMAHWDLRALAARLPQLRTPLQLLVAESDRTLPPSQTQRLAALLPQAGLITLSGLGHLAHEEDAQRIFDVLWPLVERRCVAAS